MDDIRRPQHLKRRDYSVPAGRPPVHRPVQSAPHQYPPQHPNHPSHQEPPAPAAYVPTPVINHSSQSTPLPSPTHPQHQHPPHTKPRTTKLTSRGLPLVIAGLVAAAAIFGAGYLLKGSNETNGIPANITRQVNYDLYFPSPMPRGYTYMKDTATFQIGQVYYKFANGKKRVTVIEQPLTDPKPDLNLLQGYEQFDTAVGKAAIGTNVGQTQAVIITPTTVITMNTIGGVTKDELKTAANNLKNIGQKDQKT